MAAIATYKEERKRRRIHLQCPSLHRSLIFLEERESRRERRRRQHEEEGKNATLLWAKNIAQQVDDIKNEKRRKLLKQNDAAVNRVPNGRPQ